MNGIEAVAVLSTAAARYARTGDELATLSCLWWADLRVIERTMYDSWPDATRQEWFVLWSEIVEAMDDEAASSELDDHNTTLATVIARRRGTATEVLARHGIEMDAQGFADVSVALQLRVPTQDQLAAEVHRRLGGRTIEEYTAAQRRESVDAMIKAHRANADDDLTAAIGHAYDSDMAAVDAYFAESAKAAGDRYLTSWIARWELVSARVSTISVLPRGLAAATTVVRTCMTEALGEPDASRLLATLQQV